MADDITFAYEVYEGGICKCILFFADEAVSLELHLGPVESVEGGVTHATGTGPLSVKFRLRPLVAVVLHVGEDIRDHLGGANVPESALSGKPEGAAACRLIGEVYGVALGYEIGCPAWPSIGSVQEVGAGLSRACNEDDGKRWFRRGWVRAKLLDVYLPDESLGCSVGVMVLFPFLDASRLAGMEACRDVRVPSANVDHLALGNNILQLGTLGLRIAA